MDNPGAATDWTLALLGVDVVIHATGWALAMKDPTNDPLREFRKVNLDGALSLGRQAKAQPTDLFFNTKRRHQTLKTTLN